MFIITYEDDYLLSLESLKIFIAQRGQFVFIYMRLDKCLRTPI